MRKLFFALLSLLPLAAATAQTVSDFESPVLPKSDTFYLNYGRLNTDRGFDNGFVHFPFYTDSFMTTAYWKSGFVYSNVKDSVDGGPGNQYAARAGAGVNGSSQYAAVHVNSVYGDSVKIFLRGAAAGKTVRGFYVTNSSYAYYSMKFGDSFSRRFGDTAGTNSHLPKGGFPDFFRLIISGYSGGTLKPDTVQFYLADFRPADSTLDYIIKDWRWISLYKLGPVDSIRIALESSDTASFGGITYLNKPSYFCMDNFTTNDGVGIPGAPSAFMAKVFPNPAHDRLSIELAANADAQRLEVCDMAGRILLSKNIAGLHEEVALTDWPAGPYILRLISATGEMASSRFNKQ